jgi:hypothetical protein
MAIDSAFWRGLRGDFEGLQPEQFTLTWSSHLPTSLKGERLQSQWTWWRFPDESLRARLRALALRGARALGYESEDAWFDRLREADFVKFKLAGHSLERQPDGSMLEPRDGSIDDVVKQSITLCHVLEADCVESLAKGSSCGRRAAEGGFAKPGPPQPDSSTAVNGGNQKNCSGADWATIEILFLSDERVQIRNGVHTETRNYAELGFADRRIERGKEAKPNLAWVILRALAEQNGIIRDGSKTGVAWPKVEKRMQFIRKALRKHFGIAADPVPFVAGTGYEASFKIGCGPSFHS